MDPLLRRALVAGPLIGLAATAALVVAHALLVKPASGPAFVGALFSLAGGLAAGWAWTETQRGIRSIHGVAFGALAASFLFPAVAVSLAIEHERGVAPDVSGWALAAIVLLPVAAGALFGGVVAKRARAALALGLLALLETFAFSPQIAASQLRGGVAAFLALVLAALVAAGWAMERATAARPFEASAEDGRQRPHV